jgi:hypothetical protein
MLLFSVNSIFDTIYITKYTNMKILWLERKIDLEDLKLAESLYPHISLAKNLRSKEADMNLVFNSRKSLVTFMNNLGRFNMDFNKLQFQLGIAEANNPTDFHPENLIITETPLVFFGDEEQMRGFTKMFGQKAAIISNTCKKNFRTIAYQRHLCDQLHLGSVSLGEFKQDFGRAESTLRNAHGIMFEMNAIRKQDSYFRQSAITGLDIYEACNILRYCGLSTEHFFLFFNLFDDDNLLGENWECLALLFWYYLEGKNQAELDNIDHEENNVYMVENNFFAEPVSFIQTCQTKRWWFIHPETKEKVPCSEQDYNAFREGVLPDILVSITAG